MIHQPTRRGRPRAALALATGAVTLTGAASFLFPAVAGAATNPVPASVTQASCGAGSWSNYTVPAGVTSARVTLVGGGGGGGPRYSGVGEPGRGGGGQRITTTVDNLSPGQTLAATLGCGGGGGFAGSGGFGTLHFGATGGSSGFGTGGNSGDATVGMATGGAATGGAGGGASALCIGSSGCTQLIAIAGGGGGGAGIMREDPTATPQNGGAGGDANGIVGEHGGGTDIGSGAGGDGRYDRDGYPGSGRNGGRGGPSNDPFYFLSASGGGGGGGYYGGGGGGSDMGDAWASAGGGGAGSSFLNETYTSNSDAIRQTATTQGCGSQRQQCTTAADGQHGLGGRAGTAASTHGATGNPGTISIVWNAGPASTTWSSIPDSVSGAPLTGDPQVTVTDFAGNPVAGEPIELELAPGSSGTLTCDGPATTNASGVATFEGCTITGPVGTYELQVVDPTTDEVLTGTGTVNLIDPASVPMVDPQIGLALAAVAGLGGGSVLLRRRHRTAA